MPVRRTRSCGDLVPSVTDSGNDWGNLFTYQSALIYVTCISSPDPVLRSTFLQLLSRLVRGIVVRGRRDSRRARLTARRA